MVKFDKHNDYWSEVEESLKEEKASGYKMAILEADKILRLILKQKGFPGKDLAQQIFYAGWKLEDKTGLKKAVEKRDEIVSSLDYKLSTFEAEDAVNAYKEAILHFSSKKSVGLKKKLTLYYNHYLSFKSSFFQKSIAFILLFFLAVKFITATEMGRNISKTTVLISEFIFSWFMVFILIGAAIFIIVLGSFLYFGREKTRIKEEI